MDLGMEIDLSKIGKWIIAGYLGMILFVGYKFDITSAILLLVMGVVAVVGLMFILFSFGVTTTKPRPVQGGARRRGIPISKSDPPANPPENADPNPEIKPEQDVKTFCVVVEGTHNGVSRFKKIFSERLAQWTSMQPVKENQKNRAYIVIGFKVHRHIQRNALDSYVLFSYDGWLTQTQEAFCHGAETAREIAYGNDDIKLFEGAAFKIASALTQNYPDIFL